MVCVLSATQQLVRLIQMSCKWSCEKGPRIGRNAQWIWGKLPFLKPLVTGLRDFSIGISKAGEFLHKETFASNLN